MSTSDELRVIRAGVRIRISGPDEFVIAGPSGSVVGDSSTVRLVSCFARPAAPGKVLEDLREEYGSEELEEAVALLERQGIIGVSTPPEASLELCPESSCWTLAEGVDLLQGEHRVGLLRTASQELQLFVGLHGLVAEMLPPAGRGAIGVGEIVERIRRVDEGLTPLDVRAAIGDLAEIGLVGVTRERAP